MTTTVFQASEASTRCELHATERVRAREFAAIRQHAVLDWCKWDPQIADAGVLGDFALIISRQTHMQLDAWAEELAADLMAAEKELLHRPELHRELGLPRRLRRVMQEAAETAVTPAAARVMRFDFHPTNEGWRISEVNSDVPGGFTEAGPFTSLMAEHFAGAKAPDDPGRRWAEAIARGREGNGPVMLLAATGLMEDQQIIAYMSRLLEACGVAALMAGPAQLQWREGQAMWPAEWSGAEVSTIVRFYQGEWFASLPRRMQWRKLFAGGRTPVTNPPGALLTESKRLPLVWDRLRAKMPRWRELLPETRDLHDAPWRTDEGWVLKGAYSNTGDAVLARGLLSGRQWRAVGWEARLFPRAWVAQRRFVPTSIQTPAGSMYPCVGVYVIDGQAAGIYTRLSARPVVDFTAIDVATLIEEEA